MPKLLSANANVELEDGSTLQMSLYPNNMTPPATMHTTNDPVAYGVEVPPQPQPEQIRLGNGQLVEWVVANSQAIATLLTLFGVKTPKL